MTDGELDALLRREAARPAEPADGPALLAGARVRLARARRARRLGGAATAAAVLALPLAVLLAPRPGPAGDEDLYGYLAGALEAGPAVELADMDVIPVPDDPLAFLERAGGD